MRSYNRLSALAVKKLAQPGLYADGTGLYLVIGDAGNKHWSFRFMLNGKARQMGLGSLHTVSLAEARGRAARARLLRQDGIDPIEERKSRRAVARAEADQSAATTKGVTFREAAEAFMSAHEAAWKNAKHAAQWSSTLSAYAYPVIGKLSVAGITTEHVLRIVEPIWISKNETAGRIRGRIEKVLDYAETREWREGENPARWSGHMSKLLPKRSKVAKVEHHPALPWKEAPAFMARLAEQAGIAAFALRFLILTATRTSEVIGARWSEIDQDSAVWTIPAQRTKAGREHRVPLSEAALKTLTMLPASNRDHRAFVFSGGKAEKGLSNMAMPVLLERMGQRGDVTVHGFRSTFRDYAWDATDYPREIAEQALAHMLKDKTEAAYRRSDALERRRKLMADWATFCMEGKASV